jgi:polysaccharide deacetylase family protein (PEP-CTERM system associated)
MLNALTVDVEDYYQVSAFEHRVARSDWDSYESRVVANTRRLLGVLDEAGVRGTFFVLGWVADRFPGLVRDIDQRGHEIGSHSYWHRLIYGMTPDEFRADLRQSKAVLEDILGRAITLFRAPSFSITAQSRWALDVLAEEGIRVDSSVYPVRHDRYGMPGAPRTPHAFDLPAGRLLEYPPSTLADRFRLPVSGGGYFRLYPLGLTRHAAARVNRQGCPFMFYIHPWELDPEQPRIAGIGWKSRLRHSVNLSTTEAKLRRLLQGVTFGTLTESLAQVLPEAREPAAAARAAREPHASGVQPASPVAVGD